MGVKVRQKAKKLDSVTSIVTAIPELYETEPLCLVELPEVFPILQALEEDESLGQSEDEERRPDVLDHALHEGADWAACARDVNGTRLEPCAPEPIVHFFADFLRQGLITVAAVDNANANSAGSR